MTLPELTESMNLTLPGRRVLVVEDYVPWLVRLSAYWREAGHEVISLTGVLSIESFIAIGIPIDATESVSVDLRTVDAAFLDYFFNGRSYNGGSLTHELMLACSPRIMGMSSNESGNAAMRRAGAITSLPKAELMRLFS